MGLVDADANFDLLEMPFVYPRRFELSLSLEKEVQ